MPIPTSFTDLSTTAASNSPAGGDTPAEGDNHIRTIYAFLRSIFSNSGNGWTAPYATTGALAALPTLDSGTYTPTITAVANIDSTTAQTARYLRVGANVTVFGTVTVDPTSINTITTLRVSLPIASNLTGNDLSGVVSVSTGGFTYLSGLVIPNTGVDAASIGYKTDSDNSAAVVSYSFTYTVA